MDIFWVVVTVLVVVVVVGLWILLGLRGHLLTRAEHVDPDQAKALRDVQRQIDEGHKYR